MPLPKAEQSLAPERESLLRAVINRVALMSEGDWVSPVHLPPEIAAAGVLEDPPLPARPESGPIPMLEAVELAYIRRA